VDALNGVDVVLPAAVDGRAEGMGYFPAGPQHLTGAMALDLVRISMAGERERSDRQELIIQAVYQSLMTPKNWDRLPALIEASHDNIFTDLSVNQILGVSCILDQSGVVVNQQQVGPELVVFSGQSMLPRPELSQYILQTVGK
jgi:anionic cell wall polymer biosynthesis LytR-Cps2A-Psr (LCP) family protein